MHPILRTAKVAAAAFVRPRLGPLDRSVVTMRVWPNDLDTNVHLNNGRYLTLMDLGRMDLAIRMGVVGVIRRKRWFPVLGSAAIRFRRPLHPFERFALISRIVGWDDKWLYMEHRMESGRHLAAIAVVKALFRGREGSVPSAELVRVLGHDGPSPELPSYLRDWQQMEQDLAGAETTMEAGTRAA
jgi:acyl-CoA thioesterase FadM